MRLKSNMVQFGLIFVISIFVALGVFSYTSGVESKIRAEMKTESIYIALTQIPAGTALDIALQNQSIEAKEFPEKSIPSDALQDISKLSRQSVANFTIQPGQVILNGSFGIGGNPTSSLVIPEGKLAISVTIPEAERVAGFVQPGSQVSVFISGKKNEKAGSEITRVLLNQILVLAVGSQVSSTTNIINGEGSSLVTLAVFPSEATALVHASKFFTIHLGLIGSKVNLNETNPIDNSKIFVE